MIALLFSSLLLLSTLDSTEIMNHVSALRGLPFKTPVTVKKISRSELDPFIHEAIRDSYGDDLSGITEWLEELHLLPEETDLTAMLLNLYKSQVAAFYNPKDHTYYMVEGVGDEGMMAKMVASHEFMHALQDQHMGLQERMNELKENHDAQLALQSLLEGEATLIMVSEQMALTSASDLKSFSDSMELFVPTMMDVVGDFPPYLVHEMIFPYVSGTRFIVSEMGEKVNWEAMNQWYSNPPHTTEMILHPERDHTAPADFDALLEELMPKEWKHAYDDTLGESTWLYLFRDALSKEGGSAAEGWDGDRVGLYRKGESSILVWLTRWDSEKDRKEAERGLVAYAEMKKMDLEIKGRGSVLVAVSGDIERAKKVIKSVKKNLKRLEDVHGNECSK